MKGKTKERMDFRHAIVFDLGGVLIDWNPRNLYRKMFDGDEQAMERFLAEVCTLEWNARQDEGRSFADATTELIARHPDKEWLIRAWFDRWLEMITGPIDGTVEIISELKKAEHKVYALSNWSAETYPLARQRFSFFDCFDRVVISGEIKLVKPNREIFDHLLEKIERRAEECIFIDDSLTNVNAAAQFGFDTIHFQSPEQLRNELSIRGILRS
jgi:HAD superfamily hydrolase (TIGR01509 family)